MTPTRPRLDLVERIAAVVVATFGAVLVAIVTAFLVPLRLGDVRIPLCFLIVIVGNAAVVRFAYRATGSKVAVGPPCLAWFATMLPLTFRTTEGDLVVAGNWVGVGLLFCGAMSLAVAVVLAIMSDGPGWVPAGSAGAVEPGSEQGAQQLDSTEKEDSRETVTPHRGRGTM